MRSETQQIIAIYREIESSARQVRVSELEEMRHALSLTHEILRSSLGRPIDISFIGQAETRISEIIEMYESLDPSADDLFLENSVAAAQEMLTGVRSSIRVSGVVMNCAI